MEIFIIVTVKFNQEKDKRWVAECIELGTSSFGDTLGEAEETIRDMIKLHLNTLEDVDERERFFKEHHIKIYKTKPPAEVRIPRAIIKESFVREYQLPVYN